MPAIALGTPNFTMDQTRLLKRERSGQSFEGNTVICKACGGIRVVLDKAIDDSAIHSTQLCVCQFQTHRCPTCRQPAKIAYAVDANLTVLTCAQGHSWCRSVNLESEPLKSRLESTAGDRLSI